MGLAAAQKFAEAGASVVLAGRHEPREQAQNLIDRGYKAISVRCDVASEDDAKAMVEHTVDIFGRLDFAYNNAGIQSPITKTSEASSEEYDKILSINLRGIWNCMKYELRQMEKQGEGGAIVNCSSLGGLVGLPGRGAYHASKHGVLGLTKSSALEYANLGIRINAVCPGVIETPMVADMLTLEKDAMDEYMRDVPIGRMGRAEEIADAVLWLCSPGSSYVIGHALAVDGGYTIH